MVCLVDGAKPLSEPMMIYCQLDHKEHISMKSYLKFKYFQSRKCDWIDMWLDMSTAHQRLKSPQSLSGTSAHPTMVTLVNIMVKNGWLTSLSFHVNRPISDSDLEISTPRSRSWVWWKGKVIQSAQYHINSPRFHFTSIRPTIPETSYFEIWPWNIQGQGHEWGQRSRSHIVHSIQPMHFLFISHQSDQPFLRYDQNSVWPWKNTSEILKKMCQNKSLQQNCKILSGNDDD